MSRRVAPRGKAAPVARATRKSAAVAMTRRSVAAQSGGTASLPMRMARKVELQMPHITRNAAYGRQSARASASAVVMWLVIGPHERTRGADASVSADTLRARYDGTSGAACARCAPPCPGDGHGESERSRREAERGLARDERRLHDVRAGCDRHELSRERARRRHRDAVDGDAPSRPPGAIDEDPAR